MTSAWSRHSGCTGQAAQTRLGGGLPLAAHGLALAVRVEEQVAAPAAGGQQLPLPAPGLRAGGLGGADDVGHGDSSGSGAPSIYYDR